MSELKYYLVENKDDDYGNNIRELVQTTPELADEYYGYTEVPESHIEVLKNYFGLIEYQEEKERTPDRRFYGTVEE